MRAPSWPQDYPRNSFGDCRLEPEIEDAPDYGRYLREEDGALDLVQVSGFGFHA